jgi:methylamine utilization protein MauE
MLPETVVLLAILTAFTSYSISSGRVTDCGCYGGMIVPSMPQTLAINGVMIARVASAIVWGTWQLLSYIVGTVVVAFFPAAATS